MNCNSVDEMDDTTLIDTSLEEDALLNSSHKKQDDSNPKERIVTTKNSFKVPFRVSKQPNTLKKDFSDGIHLPIHNSFILKNKELVRERKMLKTEISELKNGIKILENFQKEREVLELINKWRGVSQCGMSYIHNSTLIKINKMGGYTNFLKTELESEKDKIEYQFELEADIESYFESEEFINMCADDQQEVRVQVDEKMFEFERVKEKKIKEIDKKMDEIENCNPDKQIFSMKELAKRLNVEYNLVFPE